MITQENKGVLAVINRGLLEAQGEYIAFLSADDVLRPRYVEILLRALLTRPGASYAYSAMEYFGSPDRGASCSPFSPAVLLARQLRERNCAHPPVRRACRRWVRSSL